MTTTLKRPEGNLPEDFHLSRRGIASVFFAGYAVAALSAEAAPISTDAAGLTVETVKLASGIPAYVARPAGAGKHPVVIVVNEIFGIHDYIKDTCRRLAKLGYVAIAPAFFVRVGDPAPLSDMAEIRKIVGAASDTQVMGDVDSALKFLKTTSYADSSKIAITGFCWGGGVVWLAAERFAAIKAGAAWYGRLAPAPGATPVAGQMWPIDGVKDLHGPVLGLYAGKDALTNMAPDMRKALAKAEKYDSEIVVYPDAQHGFHADYRATYDERSAKDGWKRMLAHFVKNGVGTPAAKTASA
ncbi:dienelactone hydrolase family protein [soil metagenome]